MRNFAIFYIFSYMRINIYAIGKVKDKFLQEGISFYIIKLKNYADVRIIEVPDSPVRDNPNSFDIDKAKNTEGEKVLKQLKPSDFVINLDLNKKEMTSEEFSSFMIDSLVKGGSQISFVIGGSYGLSNAIKQRANDTICLSNLTFLHQMTRLILLEQIYRAFKINNNEVYHK